MRTDLNFNLGKNFNLFLAGDDHRGNAFRYHEGVEMMLGMLHQDWNGVKKNFLVHHGDITESIFWNDFRYDQDSHAFRDTIFKQVEDVVKEYRKHRKNILLLMDGNHGNTARLRPIGNPNIEICNQLQLPFGTYAAVVTYRHDNHVLFRHLVGHGWGHISSRVKPYKRAKANQEIQLRAGLENKASNCMLMSMGHVHRLVTYNPDQQLILRASPSGLRGTYSSSAMYYGDVGFIPGDLRYYACTGSFLKLFDVQKEASTGDFVSNNQHRSSYAEMAGYDPVSLGFCIAEVRDGKIQAVRKVSVDDSMGVKILD